MEINWTTFFLEIVNFTILVWLLFRFLYRPVLRVIDERRQTVQRELQSARDLQAQADDLLGQYRRQLEAWEREKREQWDVLTREIEQERARRTAVLDAELEQERLCAEASAEHRRQELQHQSERRALEQGSRFVARLLQDLAGPEMDERLAELFIAELEKLPEDQRAAFRSGFTSEEDGGLRVRSAHPLDTRLRERLTRLLQAELGEERTVEFGQDPALISGLEVSIGDWVLRANLRDELRFFSQGGLDAAAP